MSSLEWIIPVVVAVVGLFLVGSALALAWFSLRWAASLYRRWTRRHRYVPVFALVTRALHGGNSPAGVGVLWVTYEHAGRPYHNRLVVRSARALQAARSGSARLLIDPDRPTDAVVDQAGGHVVEPRDDATRSSRS